MPRLFTALEIPTPVATQLGFLQGGLPGARWIDRESLHLTLRFIGDVDQPLAHELSCEFDKVNSEPFTLKLDGLDVFGNKKPHSLIAKVQRNEALYSLQAVQERICQRLGLTPDKRKFTPHVTIARLRGANLQTIANYLSERGGFQSLEFNVSGFLLLSCRDSIGGGPYVTEERYQLIGREAEIAYRA